MYTFFQSFIPFRCMYSCSYWLMFFLMLLFINQSVWSGIYPLIYTFNRTFIHSFITPTHSYDCIPIFHLSRRCYIHILLTYTFYNSPLRFMFNCRTGYFGFVLDVMICELLCNNLDGRWNCQCCSVGVYVYSNSGMRTWVGGWVVRWVNG
jgi:hypothetical protein